MSDTTLLSTFAEDAKSWPFAEARALRDRLQKMGHDPAKPVLFETGYGPSGLPHIGTFGEVVRTSFVRHAFETLTGWPTRLICFSDDMDGLRKVPDNIPNPEKIAPFLNQPLTVVPDPFGTHDSFGAHNNARLMAFLDGFGFDYEFISASRSSCQPWAQNARQPTARFCLYAHAPARSCRWPLRQLMKRQAPLAMMTQKQVMK